MVPNNKDHLTGRNVFLSEHIALFSVGTVCHFYAATFRRYIPSIVEKVL